jgi:hypothetical protein
MDHMVAGDSNGGEHLWTEARVNASRREQRGRKTKKRPERTRRVPGR